MLHEVLANIWPSIRVRAGEDGTESMHPEDAGMPSISWLGAELDEVEITVNSPKTRHELQAFGR